MLAIIRQHQPSGKKFAEHLFLPAFTTTRTQLGEELLEIASLNPLYRRRFPKILSKIRQQCSHIFFTEEMKQYPDIYHEASQGACFFRHLEEILFKMPKQDVSDVGIFCEKEDPRLIPLAELLSRFSPSVSVVTEKDAFFERVANNLLLSNGLSLTQKTLASVGKKRLMILLNSTLSDYRAYGEYLIDLNDTTDLCHKNLLWDITTEEVSESFDAFSVHGLKHCHFVPAGEEKLKLIWKISKKS